MKTQIQAFYAEIRAVIMGDQFAIRIGPFIKPATDAEVFMVAHAMGLNPVETREPIWSSRKRVLVP